MPSCPTTMAEASPPQFNSRTRTGSSTTSWVPTRPRAARSRGLGGPHSQAGMTAATKAPVTDRPRKGQPANNHCERNRPRRAIVPPASPRGIDARCKPLRGHLVNGQRGGRQGGVWRTAVCHDRPRHACSHPAFSRRALKQLWHSPCPLAE